MIKNKPKKIFFFIRSLNAGGAERQLVVTAKGLAERGHKVTILTFYSGGFYEDELLDTKVQLKSLHKEGRWDVLFFLFRLTNVLRAQKPMVIYSFLGTANILAVIMRPFLPATKLVWGVRASNMDLDKYDWLTRWSYWLECKLSRFADTIIANSNAGLEYAVEHGFPKEKMSVIPNGIDTEKFRPDKSAGKLLRKEWCVTEDQRLIGVVGRIDPMKGIPTFLEAVKIIMQSHSQIRFVWVGVGDADFEQSMHQLASQLGLDKVMTWAGRYDDMLAVYNAFDIASSSSYGEGFPNVIGEAMACCVPCVVTDAGDSALIVDETGIVVPAKDSEALAAGWKNLFLLDEVRFQERSAAARKRIINLFSVVDLCIKTEQLL